MRGERRFTAIPAIRALSSGVVGLYRLWLAVMLWSKKVEAGTRVVQWRRVIVAKLLNPKAVVFALRLIPLQTTRRGHSD